LLQQKNQQIQVTFGDGYGVDRGGNGNDGGAREAGAALSGQWWGCIRGVQAAVHPRWRGVGGAF